MNRIWAMKHTHHQVCHWPGLSFCALATLSPWADRYARSPGGIFETDFSAAPADCTLAPLAFRKARADGGTLPSACRRAVACAGVIRNALAISPTALTPAAWLVGVL